MRILVVDREEAMAEIVAAMLTADGHFVETATNGDDALRIYAYYFSEGESFDFVLTGVMGGINLIEEILKKNPRQRWGICTSRPVLQKPFDRSQLYAFINSQR